MEKVFKNKFFITVEVIISVLILYKLYLKVEFLNKGGFFILPLLYCLLFVFIITIDRLFYIRKLSKNTFKLMKNVEDDLESNSYEQILSECNKYDTPMSTILKTAIKYKDRTEDKIKEMIIELGSFEIHNLKKNIDLLSLIAKISPLIGLLGTVTGLMKSFNQMVYYNGNVSPNILAGGISEALLTTIVGLSIAIPAIIIYQYFSIKINNFIHQMEKFASMVVLKIK